MHMPNMKWVALALAATFSAGANAAVQDVKVGTPLPRLELLKAGTHHYLRSRARGCADGNWRRRTTKRSGVLTA